MELILESVGFGIVSASVLAIATVGFTLQFGASNIFNLAYGDIMTASAFVAYLAGLRFANLWLELLIGGVFGAVLSLVTNRFIYGPFARRGAKLFGMIIVSIAVSLVIANLLQAFTGANFFSLELPRTQSLNVGPFILTGRQLIVIGLGLGAMILIHLLLSRTRLGRAIRATAANAPLARNCGIPTQRVIDYAWLLSGFLCGIGGVILVAGVNSFDFSTGGQFIIPVLAAAILGGIGQPYGAMLGALCIGLVSELSAALISPDYKELSAFVILVLVLLVRPRGIFSEAASQKELVTG